MPSVLDNTINMLRIVSADWQGAMQEVLNSNMSKFTQYNPSYMEEYDNHCKVLEEGGRYSGVTWELNNGYVIWKDDNNKILKGNEYRKADVHWFVN